MNFEFDTCIFRDNFTFNQNDNLYDLKKYQHYYFLHLNLKNYQILMYQDSFLYLKKSYALDNVLNLDILLGHQLRLYIHLKLLHFYLYLYYLLIYILNHLLKHPNNIHFCHQENIKLNDLYVLNYFLHQLNSFLK